MSGRACTKWIREVDSGKTIPICSLLQAAATSWQPAPHEAEEPESRLLPFPFTYLTQSMLDPASARYLCHSHADNIIILLMSTLVGLVKKISIMMARRLRSCSLVSEPMPDAPLVSRARCVVDLHLSLCLDYIQVLCVWSGTHCLLNLRVVALPILSLLGLCI